MKEQIEEMAIEEMSRFITCVDIETEPEGTCCRMNFDQADTMACALYNAGYRKQSENVIELPCKIGDTVYIIDECGDGECAEDYVLAVKVLHFFINEHGIAVDLALPLGMRVNTWMVVGKNVFLTKEEAENALAKMKGEENEKI